MKYSISNDTVTVFLKGEPHSVAKGAPNFDKLRAAVLAEDWDRVPQLLTPEKAVVDWAEVHLTEGVTVADNRVLYNGEPMPVALNDRILKMVAKNESAKGIINFWKRLRRNPNQRSVDQLWGFLAHSGIPVQEDGTFLAYKGVRRNFRDAHSGQFDNSPGKTVRMDRNKISTDPAQTCHVGLHVGALSYAGSFSEQCVIVRVDPEHVCCVPNDYSASKMRVCEYTVMGLYGSKMPDTAFQADAPVTVESVTPIVDDVATQEVVSPLVEEKDIPLSGTPWDDFNPMSIEELSGQSLDDLRKYARYNCLITGASKLPGGKDALVAKIIEVRTKPVKAEPPVPTPAVVVEDTKPMAPGEQAAVSLPRTGTEWDRLNGLNSIELLDESLDSLRKYAAHNCLIVGASKMGGGKVALVARIAQVRGDATTE